MGQFQVGNKTVTQIEAELKPILAELFVAINDFYVELRSRDIFINVFRVCDHALTGEYS